MAVTVISRADALKDFWGISVNETDQNNNNNESLLLLSLLPQLEQ
jgi:hypothetical protein